MEWSDWMVKEVLGCEKTMEVDGMRMNDDAVGVVLDGAVVERRDTITVDPKDGAFEMGGVIDRMEG